MIEVATTAKDRKITAIREIQESMVKKGNKVALSTLKKQLAQPRKDWLSDQEQLREAIRSYHDDEGHSWSETALHFHMSQGAVRQRAYRARNDRAQ